jgi:hypothetical protein
MEPTDAPSDAPRTPAPNAELLESRARQWGRLLVIPFAAAATLATLAASLHPVVIASAPIAVILSMLAMFTLAKRPRRRSARGEVRVDARGLHVGGRLAVPRARLRDALVVPGTREGPLVRIGRGVRSTDLVVASVEDGRALLAKLGLDAASSTAEIAVRAPDLEHYRKRTWAILCLVPFLPIAIVLALAFGGVLLALPLAGMLAFLPLALSLAVSGSVTVGTDGVLLRWLWQRRFIALDDVVDAEVGDAELVLNNTPRVVRLLRADGSVKDELMIDLWQEGPFQEPIRSGVEARAQAIAERIREAIAARREAIATAEVGSLARARRPIDAWLAHLRGLLARTETFRGEAPPTREALLQLVEDSTARPELRAAAAVAVASAGGEDEAARGRLRVAADASAAPRLRIALRAAAERDDAELAAAMEELESEGSSEAPGPGKQSER